MIGIMHNAIDDYSMSLESALGISILHEVKEDFKKWHILDQQEEHKKLHWYLASFGIVLASLAVGIGGEETAMLLGFLDLPWSRLFGPYSFGKVEA
eukprot:11277583-Ditylum_brightwellii.AAC.1